MNITKQIVAATAMAAAAGVMTLGGCKGSNKGETTKSESGIVVPAKEMTHVLTADQPCMMAKTGPACGTLTKGTKVLLLVPGDPAQVETTDGKQLYTPMAALELLAAPAPMPKKMMPATKPAAAKPPEMSKYNYVLSKDQPYYASMPTADAKPAGTLKAGTKVLLLVPGESAQVETADGKQVYTPMAGVDLIPMKK